MARHVASAAELSGDDWYVPDIEDNRSDPNPFRVRISPASAADIRKVESDLIGSLTNAKASARFERAYRAQLEIISKYVTAVENYSIREAKTGTVRTPKNGAELVDAVMEASESEVAVLDDVLLAIKSTSKLAEGMEKKLRSQRGSRSPAIAPGTGDAPSVAETHPATSNGKPAAVSGTIHPSPSPSPPSS